MSNGLREYRPQNASLSVFRSFGLHMYKSLQSRSMCRVRSAASFPRFPFLPFFYPFLPSLTFRGTHSWNMRWRKYVLSNLSGLKLHGPSNPERTSWQRPSVCAPERATISWSENPMRWKTSRRCCAPCAASGSLPIAGHAAAVSASPRPNLNSIFGPPRASIATQPCRFTPTAEFYMGAPASEGGGELREVRVVESVSVVLHHETMNSPQTPRYQRVRCWDTWP